ncbi:four helix bundle protein [Terribacillus saccharophilus]|uniref:four helix bundle protein n=1 Tax=Terribacillus saccharophilus TaxID=361277 RepID=UPI0015CEF868|nr:four helix bundle protein [Terribacillus saccharophilus]
MNSLVRRVLEDYWKFREINNDIEKIGIYLRKLAEDGLIWILKGTDICEVEKIVIEKFLNDYRAEQVYDNLEDIHYIQPLIDTTTNTPSPIKLPSDANITPIRNVKNFKGYKKAEELENKIYELCMTYPSFEKYHIVDQIKRSASSIKEQIASGEQHFIRNKFKHYSYAIGSAKETSAWLDISLNQSYISEYQFNELDRLVQETVSILTRTLVNLKAESSDIELPSPYTPDVRKFNAYQESIILVGKIYSLTKSKEFWDEKYIQKRLRQYASSCVANIAEGHQLYIPTKFRFFNSALEALNGLEVLLDTALSNGIISSENQRSIVEVGTLIKKVLLKTLKNISGEKR